MDILCLLSTLQKDPELCSVFDYKAIKRYIDLVNLVKPIISNIQHSYEVEPPETLPVNVHEFLKKCFNMSDYMGKLAWLRFRTFAWGTLFLEVGEEHAAVVRNVKLFLKHGISCKIGVYNLQAPTRVCVDPRCNKELLASKTILQGHELTEPRSFPITVFTRDLGAVPGFATSRYCRKCNTRYHPNYYVHSSASIRSYYPDVPNFIQSTQHFYISADLCELFATMMVTSWTSATNCARVYNEGLEDPKIRARLPADWQTSLELDVEDVWSAFFLHSLIMDHYELGATLELQHNAESQAARLQPALQARNARMAGPGQEAWNHACDRCCYIDQDSDGNYYQIRSTVTDGITIGRPCCAEHDCTEALPTVKHRYCRAHSALARVCSVVSCKDQVEPGFRTCKMVEHRQLEAYHHQQGKAMFQLKHRLNRLRVSQTHNSVASQPSAASSRFTNEERETGANDLQPISNNPEGVPAVLEGVGADEDEDVVIDSNGICDGKPEKGNRSVRARFGRRRTHNEELCVGSCGVILGRATFYGSEAPNGVRTFWMKLFPTQASLPFVLWHDNNCRVVSMLNNDDASDDPRRGYFDRCALPVDVFHFKCKHKEADIDCGKYCNPYIWPELRTEDGKWRFNSSAAEQTNAWFGGFQAMVREMQADRYDFFLDEMIKRRNRILIKDLERKGAAPYSIPREDLLGSVA